MVDWGDTHRRLAGIVGAAQGDGDIDVAISDLLELPDGLPGRGKLAAGLLLVLLQEDQANQVGHARTRERRRQVEALLAMADGDPPAQWPRLRAMARAYVLMLLAATHELPDPRAALRELDELSATAGADPSLEAVAADGEDGDQCRDGHVGGRHTDDPGDAGVGEDLARARTVRTSIRPQTCLPWPRR